MTVFAVVFLCFLLSRPCCCSVHAFFCYFFQSLRWRWTTLKISLSLQCWFLCSSRWEQDWQACWSDRARVQESGVLGRLSAWGQEKGFQLRAFQFLSEHLCYSCCDSVTFVLRSVMLFWPSMLWQFWFINAIHVHMVLIVTCILWRDELDL